MKHFSIVCLSAACLLGSMNTFAQGDSDPGMSTLGGLRSGSTIMISEEEYENGQTQFSVSHTFAKGDRDVIINNPQIEMRTPIGEIGYFEAKIQLYAAAGDLAKVIGFGDIQLGYTHFIPNPEAWSWQFVGGTRIGTGSGTITDGSSRPLPMVYQSSQGTTDVILGATASYKQYVNVALGYQQPIIRYNTNNYTRWTPYNEMAYSNSEYPLSRYLYRNGDLMMRAEAGYSGDRAGFYAGPLAFYHLAEDLYTDEANKVRELSGSDGFSLNIAGSAFVRFGRYASWKLDVSGGYPLVQRDVHPDGSMRQWVITPRLTYFFGQEYVRFN